MTKPHQPCFIRRPLPAKIERVYLIGIAGAAMGAFACMLQERGYAVRGADLNVYPPMSVVLTERGIPWSEGYTAAQLHDAQGLPDLVIVGNVCRRDNPIVLEADRLGVPSISLPQALSDLFLVGQVPVVVTGTHGKTTTTALLSWILDAAGLGPGMLLGGVHRNFDDAYRLPAQPGAPFVVEGDEYDTAFFDKGPKFLHYRPQIAILNNVEFDHADIYDDLEEIIENFDRFMALLTPQTILWANADDPLVRARAALAQGQVRFYGLGEGAELRATEIEVDAAGTHFTVHEGARLLGRLHSPLAGHHNVYNTLAALGVALSLGLSFGAFAQHLPKFLGVKKRQEERGEAAGVLVIDDYAHHPTAIRETLTALRRRYPGRRLWGIYEPKSNTARRNIHQQEYATAFADADIAVLARPFQKKNDFAADERLDLDRLVAEIRAGGAEAHHCPSTQATLDLLLAQVRAQDLVVFMSSSSFDGIHEQLLATLRERERGD